MVLFELKILEIHQWILLKKNKMKFNDILLKEADDLFLISPILLLILHNN